MGDVDGTGCVVQYEHPLCSDRCSFVKLPADLNGALLLKHRGNQQWNSTPPGRGPRWTRASFGDLQIKGSFPRHTPEGQTVLKELFHIEGHFLQRIKKSSMAGIFIKSTYKPQKMLFLSLFYLQFAVRNSLKHSIHWANRKHSKESNCYYNKTSLFQCGFNHPTDFIAISHHSDSVLAY